MGGNMKSDAIINGKRVKLTEAERKAGENFHRMRYAFAWINGMLVFNNNENDDRDHQHWLCEDYGLTVSQWEKLNRGYMMQDRIQLFKGSKFEPINTDEIPTMDIVKLTSIHGQRYGTDRVVIYNGVKIGKIGEVWEPLIRLGEFDTHWR